MIIHSVKIRYDEGRKACTRTLGSGCSLMCGLLASNSNPSAWRDHSVGTSNGRVRFEVRRETSLTMLASGAGRHLGVAHLWNRKGGTFSEGVSVATLQGKSKLGGGFKHFLFFTPIWGRFPF